MHKQPLPKFFFCINSNHENCEKEMFLFLFSHCWSTLSAWHSATRPFQPAALGVWQLQFKHCFLGHWHQAGQRGGKLLQVVSLHPCEYMSSEELAVSGQGKAAAAMRKLPSSMKGWREVDCMTVKGRVWAEKCAYKCAAPSFESTAMGKQTNRTWVRGFKEC